MKEIISAFVAAVALLAIGFGFGSWRAKVRLEADTRVAIERLGRQTDSLRIALVVQRRAADSLSRVATVLRDRFEADSSHQLRASHRLLATIDSLRHRTTARDTQWVTTPSLTPTEVSEAVTGCLLTVRQCGAAREAAEVARDSMQSALTTALRRIAADSLQFVEQARLLSIERARVAAFSLVRDVKLVGGTTLIMGAACAVSHIKNPFGGR